MAELILADNDENSDNFSLSRNSSYRDSDEDFEQTGLPPSNLDEPCSTYLMFLAGMGTLIRLRWQPWHFFYSKLLCNKDSAVKLRKHPSSGASRPKAQDILQESGPSNYVPTSAASPKDAFDLTFVIELVYKVLELSNQRYQQYPKIILGAKKMGSEPLPVSSCYFARWTQFIFKFCRFDDSLRAHS